MIRVSRTVLLCLALVVSCFSVTTTTLLPPPVGITLVGKGEVSGNALDKSGLTGNICQASAPANCVPKAIFGGFGSDLTYTGHDNVFIAAPDRGPFDGLTDVPYLDRVHFLYLDTQVGAPFPNIQTVLLDTRLLENKSRQTFVGGAGSFVAGDDLATLRLDPEVNLPLFAGEEGKQKPAAPRSRSAKPALPKRAIAHNANDGTQHRSSSGCPISDGAPPF